MNALATKIDAIRQLQKEVASYHAVKSFETSPLECGLSFLENSFPNRMFPTAAVHEFISTTSEDAAATNGFITGLIGKFMTHGGMCAWVSSRCILFPPALKYFGIDPDRVIFFDLNNQKEALWVIEEALKCNALAAVVGEIKELSFTESRRLQLAVETSRVTAFIHRFKPRSENIVACVTRWKITSQPSDKVNDLPGVGLPKWHVRLVKVRNGKPGSWEIEWHHQNFRRITRQFIVATQNRKTG